MTFLERSPYGNRLRFSHRAAAGHADSGTKAPAGNIGINIRSGRAMAYFPFTGWKDSFFRRLHGQGATP